MYTKENKLLVSWNAGRVSTGYLSEQILNKLNYVILNVDSDTELPVLQKRLAALCLDDKTAERPVKTAFRPTLDLREKMQHIH